MELCSASTLFFHEAKRQSRFHPARLADRPVGARLFFGHTFSEATLIKLAYAYEQAGQHG